MQKGEEVILRDLATRVPYRDQMQNGKQTNEYIKDASNRKPPTQSEAMLIFLARR
jgi:hypothetical protein